MFLYRVKVEELDATRLIALKDDLTRGEESLRYHCPIREMSVVADEHDRDHRKLDIYLALEDFVERDQVQRMIGELNALIDIDAAATRAHPPRVSSELIQI